MLIEHIRPSFQRYAAGGESEKSRKRIIFIPVWISGIIGCCIIRVFPGIQVSHRYFLKATGNRVLWEVVQDYFAEMIAIFQHGAGEPPGYIRDLLQERALDYEIIPLFENGEVPGGIDATHLVFLGGLMSVNDEKVYPWLLQEKRLIRAAIRSGTPVLGICLGAQLIASALGKRVFPCREEMGWCAIRKNILQKIATSGNNLIVFQWHGECFELPEGSVLVYRGEHVPNQMFTVGSATGVQFHPEVTQEIIHDWLISVEPQKRDEIMSQTPRYILESNQICRSIFTGFLAGSTI